VTGQCDAAGKASRQHRWLGRERPLLAISPRLLAISPGLLASRAVGTPVLSGPNGHLCLTLAATALIRMVERFSMTAPAHEAGKACMNHLSGADALTVVQVVRRSSEIARRPASAGAAAPEASSGLPRTPDATDAAGRLRGEGPRLLRSQAPVTCVALTKPACLPEARRAGLRRSRPARSLGRGVA